MKSLIFLILFACGIYSQCYDCAVDYVDVYGREIEAMFVSYEKEYMRAYVSFDVEVVNVKGDVILRQQYIPEFKDTRLRIELRLIPGRFRIKVKDYKGNLLALSKEFQIN